jgi:hypothetical protein
MEGSSVLGGLAQPGRMTRQPKIIKLEKTTFVEVDILFSPFRLGVKRIANESFQIYKGVNAQRYALCPMRFFQ